MRNLESAASYVETDGGWLAGDAGQSASHSSADLYPKVVEIKRRIGADGFVMATTTNALNAASPINIILNNSSFAEDQVVQNLVEKMATLLAMHVRKSPSPVYWFGDDGDTGSFKISGPARQISVPDAPLSGLAFPVHLGGRQTGIAIFISPSITITREMQLDIHRKSYQILRELIRMELDARGKYAAINARETECLQHAGNGLTSDDIADLLHLSVHTVNAHLGSATQKLDSVNRIQAIAKAIRLGLIN